MDNAKCTHCHRRMDCTLRDLAVLTLPWVAAALDTAGSDWERSHAIMRALRGSDCSPGYTEDWKFAGAMTQRDVSDLVEAIIHREEVSLTLLCGACRHYLGPEIVGAEELGEGFGC